MAKVLIVDDTMFMRLTLANILKEAGYEVCEAKNGADMQGVYEKELPDVVLSDITMPDMDGIEGLKALRKKHPKAKVIMCSAMGQRAMVIEALQNGAYDFIVKPFEKSKVLESVKKVLAMDI